MEILGTRANLQTCQLGERTFSESHAGGRAKIHACHLPFRIPQWKKHQKKGHVCAYGDIAIIFLAAILLDALDGFGLTVNISRSLIVTADVYVQNEAYRAPLVPVDI